MPISDLSNDELDNFEANYRRTDRTEGGKYTLAEILLEKKRRKPSPFGVREVAAKIIELAAASEDGLVTYGEIWKAFSPNVAWEGHRTLRIVADSLERVIQYCVMHGLPILTVLVVRTGERTLSSQAIERIYQECRELGVNVGPDPKAFADRQIGLAKTLVVDQLPNDD